MTMKRQIYFWCFALFAFMLLLLLLREILFPFLAALAIAYSFDPAADMLERLGLSRLVSALIVTLTTMLLFILLLLVMLPLILGEMALFLEQLPHYITILHSKTIDRKSVV